MKVPFILITTCESGVIFEQEFHVGTIARAINLHIRRANQYETKIIKIECTAI